jgi:signal transduction histidine kinase
MNLETERRQQSQQWTNRGQAAPRGPVQPGKVASPARRSTDAARGPVSGECFPLTRVETRQLQERVAQLTEANGDLEAFNAAVSHDLCTPLTAINGYCQVLKEVCRDQLDDPSREYLQGIYEGTLRMKELISSLLEFSRVTRTPACRESVDLSLMANLVALELQRAEPGREASFRIAGGISGVGDPGLWRSVLDNLMGNAWKFSAGPKKTVITFGSKLLAGTQVCFVRDNGPGFDMSLADRMFLPFQRASQTGVPGHGIGLATVDRIVRRQGGRLWTESKPGAGATFFFTMS